MVGATWQWRCSPTPRGTGGCLPFEVQGLLAREAVVRTLEKLGRMDAEFPSKDSLNCVLVAL